MMSVDEVYIFSFFPKRLKFSKFEETEKVGKKMSARADHIYKTPPGWKKKTLWEFGRRNQRAAESIQ